MINLSNLHPVKLIGLTEYSKKVIKYYNNELLLKEYDDVGRPLSIAPDGRQGIFCISKDLFWNGWFILDEDVRFENEQKEFLEKVKK